MDNSDIPATWMHLQIIILWTKSEKDKYHTVHLDVDTNQHTYKTKIDSLIERTDL